MGVVCLYDPDTYSFICRSSPAQALPTLRPARSQDPLRPSTSGQSTDLPSQRSGTPTTPLGPRSPLKTRLVTAYKAKKLKNVLQENYHKNLICVADDHRISEL